MVFVTDRVAKGEAGYTCQYIKNRIKKNKNFLGVIVGSTGSGKSYAAVRLMELLGDFDIKNVCFDGEAFLKRINSGELKKGDVLIWDEVGINLDARTWQSLSNRMINYLLESFRTMNLIVFFTVPYLSFIDSKARKLLHAIYLTQRINHKSKTCKLKPLYIQTNPTTGKIYPKYLRMINKNGAIAIKTLTLSIPSPNTIKSYENKKKVFLKGLNKEILEELQNYKKRKLLLKTRGEITQRQKQIADVVAKEGGVMKAAKILGLHHATISIANRQALLKGYKPNRGK